ncbi:MAG: DUF4869 domain-containing protein [Lachnospiraceae bacterium]|nr:DUF4869 domain-containing protein [Lachnospiraceae bacterium]
MLKIYYGDMDNIIYNTSVFFKNTFRGEWFNDEKVVEMIKDVDSSEVLGNGAISSPVLGIISPERLSGGVKTLILIDKVNDKVFNASNCGDNCAGWLLKLGEEKNISVNLRHLMDFGDGTFEIYIINEDKIVHNMDELIRIAGKYV